jgi:hypothetical protein
MACDWNVVNGPPNAKIAKVLVQCKNKTPSFEVAEIVSDFLVESCSSARAPAYPNIESPIQCTKEPELGRVSHPAFGGGGFGTPVVS